MLRKLRTVFRKPSKGGGSGREAKPAEARTAKEREPSRLLAEGARAVSPSLCPCCGSENTVNTEDKVVFYCKDCGKFFNSEK